jgi:hypothetical protein
VVLIVSPDFRAATPGDADDFFIVFLLSFYRDLSAHGSPWLKDNQRRKGEPMQPKSQS